MGPKPFQLIILVSLWSLGAGQMQQVNQPDLERTRLEELRIAAGNIQKIILKKDIPAFLEFIRKDLREDFKGDLFNPDSTRYGILFDSKLLRSRSNPALPRISVRDFLLQAKKLQTEVGLIGDGEGKKRLEWGYVLYSSSQFPKSDWPSFTFFYEEGRWWLTQVLGD